MGLYNFQPQFVPFIQAGTVACPSLGRSFIGLNRNNPNLFHPHALNPFVIKDSAGATVQFTKTRTGAEKWIQSQGGAERKD